jgi:sec-independent protein translocase protein TatB
MFDFTSSKLLILGIVALLVIGPKDLPALLRSIGKYVGIIKRHAAEFRAQFDEAMRESELAELKKEVEKVGTETEAAMRAAEQSVDTEVAAAREEVDQAMAAEAKPSAEPFVHDADGLPAPGGDAPAETQPALNGSGHDSGHAAETAASEPSGDTPRSETAAAQADTKTGA